MVLKLKSSNLRSKKKVLLLFSNNINIEYLQNSPRYEQFIFESYPLNTLILENMDFNNKLVGFQSFINDLYPDYIIAHIGSAFQKNTINFCKTILTISKNLPKSQIGFDMTRKSLYSYLKSNSQIFLSPYIQEFLDFLSRQDQQLLDKDILFLIETIF